MYIDQIELRDFRNYQRETIYPDSGVNLLYGANGAGKTNVLEAIHFCALGKSHRCNLDYEAIRQDCLMGACGVNIHGNAGTRNVIVKLLRNSKGKQIFIDQKKASRLYEMMGCLKCIIFSPEDLSLIKDGPGLRRKFIDMFISQLSQRYFISLQKYHAVLDQRNNLIRKVRMGERLNDDLFSAFEQAMVENGSLIMTQRQIYLDQINHEAAYCYHQISDHEEEELTIQYASSFPVECDHATYLSMLEKNRQQDISRGTTLLGPHRDVISIQMNRKDMKLFSSQGQIRTAALSLRLSQLNIVRKETGEYPVLLLDDVLSELDMNRRMNLLGMIHGVQTFITCTDQTDLRELTTVRAFHVVKDGMIAHMENTGKENKPEENQEDPDFS